MSNIMSERARRLRREKTDAERKLWRDLRELNRQGFHFMQQAPVGPYIADFADHKAKVVIELDGGQHSEPKGLKTDAARTRWLETNGYRVLRFWNGDVVSNSQGVMTAVLSALGHLLNSEGAA
jgi:very-short-patch-repair endonuclease